MSTPDSESPYADSSAPVEIPKRISLSSQPSYSRELSATHTQRGSMLNPNVQQAQSVHSSEHGYSSSGLPSHSSLDRSVPTQDQLPELNKTATLNSLHRSSTYQNKAPLQAERHDKPMDYLQSKVCLVADDNPVFCKIMEIILQRMHLKCVIVRNGAEAIRCAMGRAVYRAIFMDIGMPIVDGDEATRMIKSTYNANRDTPIIALSTYEGEANSALYDKVLVKPVTLPHIKKLLDPADVT
ncbi:rim15, signal transduction response regulator [Coemansia brasiliensis]|uniref:Rim15, signal transduction response regulator n=1 Tax=Coemansia brasiliensis TaxID=2650707 RepID=A0A9W8I402_9FUNG|nr:rim15, signal transduction response regulator [Coemansia brasiliensis]